MLNGGVVSEGRAPAGHPSGQSGGAIDYVDVVFPDVSTCRDTKATRGPKGVRKTLRPRTVVNTPKGFIDRDGPRDAIYQRYGRGGKQVRLLYVLHRSAKIRKRFRFYEDAERITRAVSPKLFSKNFSHAIRTARR